jgi:hypothetical protein
MKDLSQASSAVLYLPKKLGSLVNKDENVSIEDTAKLIQKAAHTLINKIYRLKDGNESSEEEIE